MDAEQTQWEITTEYIQSCNCDYGCPCNFNGYPTYGNCEALVAYRITKGQFGKTSLDGISFALGAWWPKAIHEGNGIMQYFVDEKSNDEQFAAIDAITRGKHGGGVLEIFPQTASENRPLKRTKIDFHYDGYNSWFTIDGIGEVRSEHIKNPVSGDQFEGSIKLPNGIGWKEAIVTNIRRWWFKDAELNLSHENKNGHVCTANFNNSGCVA